MSLVSDTSPLHYLLMIDQIDVLPQLFQQIIIPDVVRDELLVPSAPLVIQQWIVNSPPWLNTQAVPELDETLNSLDPGEQAAISLAQTLPADLLIIDERLGRRIASERGIPIIGAASQGLVDLSDAIARLQQTNFRISRRITQKLLEDREKLE